eukprot:SAG22_NODE_2069_length_3054_cov_1.465313_6_plen_195_part_01
MCALQEIHAKKTETLKKELVQRGYAADTAALVELSKNELRAALVGMELGEVRLRAVFRPEGNFGWEDDEAGGGDTSSDEEEEMWQNISDHIGTGRRWKDCMVKFIYRDTTGAELPEDAWTEEEEKKLEGGVKRFAEAVRLCARLMCAATRRQARLVWLAVPPQRGIAGSYEQQEKIAMLELRQELHDQPANMTQL